MVAQLFEIDIICGVEVRFTGLDADYARGQFALYAVELTAVVVRHRCGGRASVTGGEDIEVAVVGCPDGLVVLRAHASAGEADFPCAGDDRSLVEIVPAVDGHECAVRILGRGNHAGGVCSRAASAVTVGHIAGVLDGPGEGVDSVMAHAHRHYGSVQSAVGFHETGEADSLAVAQEILCDVASGSTAAVYYAQIVELQIVGIVALLVLLVVAGIGRGSDDVVAPGAVSSGAVEGVLAVLDDTAVISQLEGEAGALVAVIVLETEEVVLAVEDPVGGGLGLPAVAGGCDRAFIE